MAYTIPNAFTTGTTIEANKVQENNEALRNYVNGGIGGTDISSSGWIEPKHIMKGQYFGLNNRYEMETALSIGANEIPYFHPGYFGEQLQPIGGSGRFPVPASQIDFYLEEDAKVYIYFTISPRVLSPTGQTATYEKTDVHQFLLSLRVNGSTYNSSQEYWPQQFGPVGGFEAEIVSPYRRKTHSYQMVIDMSKGNNIIELVGTSGAISVALKFYNYTIQAFY